MIGRGRFRETQGFLFFSPSLSLLLIIIQRYVAIPGFDSPTSLMVGCKKKTGISAEMLSTLLFCTEAKHVGLIEIERGSTNQTLSLFGWHRYHFLDTKSRKKNKCNQLAQTKKKKHNKIFITYSRVMCPDLTFKYMRVPLPHPQKKTLSTPISPFSDIPSKAFNNK